MPVDVAAGAFVELGFGTLLSSLGRGVEGEGEGEGAGDDRQREAGARVWHLLPRPTARGHASWSDILAGILAAEPDAFRVVSLREWLGKLEALREHEDETLRTHPALQLVAFWREAYCGGGTWRGEESWSGLQHEESTAVRGETKLARNEMDPQTHEHPTTTSGFEMSESVQAMPVLQGRPAAVHLDSGYIAKCWRWIKENV